MSSGLRAIPFLGTAFPRVAFPLCPREQEKWKCLQTTAFWPRLGKVTGSNDSKQPFCTSHGDLLQLKAIPTWAIRLQCNRGRLPYGSSLVVMPISSDVFGTLLSTAGTWSGWSACSFFLCKYFLQSSSAKTHNQCKRLLWQRFYNAAFFRRGIAFSWIGDIRGKIPAWFLVPVCGPDVLEFLLPLFEPVDAASTTSSSN